MGVASRFWNFIKGLFWQGQRSLEQANPEAVYEMAIRKMKENYQQMHTAVGRLAAERNRLRAQVKRKSEELLSIEEELEGALAEATAGNAEAAEIGEEEIDEEEYTPEEAKENEETIGIKDDDIKKAAIAATTQLT